MSFQLFQISWQSCHRATGGQLRGTSRRLFCVCATKNLEIHFQFVVFFLKISDFPILGNNSQIQKVYPLLGVAGLLRRAGLLGARPESLLLFLVLEGLDALE